MNAVVFPKGRDTITHFVKNAIRVGNDLIGSNCKLYGLKDALWDIRWTTDDLEQEPVEQVAIEEHLPKGETVTRFEDAPPRWKGKRVDLKTGQEIATKGKAASANLQAAIVANQTIMSYDIDQMERLIASARDVNALKGILVEMFRGLIAMSKLIDHNFRP